MESVNKKIIQFFSTLSDETRLKILITLTEKPKTVNEIHNHIGKDKITLSAVSHQLKQLKDIDAVIYEKKGREKKFQLSETFCWCILRNSLKHFKKKTKCGECAKLRQKIK
jgi:ArsR family transcriptional regulator